MDDAIGIVRMLDREALFLVRWELVGELLRLYKDCFLGSGDVEVDVDLRSRVGVHYI